SDDCVRNGTRPASGNVVDGNRRGHHETHRCADGRRHFHIIPDGAGGLPGCLRDLEMALRAAPDAKEAVAISGGSNRVDGGGPCGDTAAHGLEPAAPDVTDLRSGPVVFMVCSTSIRQRAYTAMSYSPRCKGYVPNCRTNFTP